MFNFLSRHGDEIKDFVNATNNKRVKFDDGEYTPLYYAIRQHNLENVKKLIEAGADVNDPVIHHHGGLERPILEAVYREDLEIVRYLLEHGAEIDYVSDWGITPLNMAMRIGNARVNKEMVLLLLRQPAIYHHFNHFHGPNPFYFDIAKAQQAERIKVGSSVLPIELCRELKRFLIN